jgi:hypothetical protein
VKVSELNVMERTARADSILTLKNLSATESATKLQCVWHGCTERLDGLKVEFRFQGGSNDLFGFAPSEKPPRSDLAAPLQSLLQKFPFISCKVLRDQPKISKATCLPVLHDDLHMEKFNLRSVLYSPEADQKRPRVDLSQELLQILEQDQQARH